MSRTKSAVGIGVSLLAGIGIASYLSGRRAVPSWSGTCSVPALDSPVDVRRDRYGIPSVHAANEADLFRAQGWLHAADRSFQMDLLRRAGTGRLAEIVGEPGIGVDRLVRTLGFVHQAKVEPDMLDPVTRGNLESYAEGVNAWLRANRGRLPVEFKLLGYKPEPWKVTDSLLATRLMALNLCGNWQVELARAEIAARCGEDVLHAIDADADSRAGFAAQLSADVLGELVTAARDMNASIGFGFGTGSNNWVIGPRRTASNGAILANDPHLDLTLPSIWFEQVLKSPTFKARGFTIPGVPGVILGHNGTIAWGFTNSCVDVQDLYVEQIDAERGTYRDTDGSDKSLEIRNERIKVKGGDTITLEVRSTRRGPLLTDAVTHELDTPLSLRWDAIRPGRISEALIGMNRATGWEDFRDALRHWTAPAQNVVYADTAGNIGYQHAGEIPVRATGNGTRPSDGTNADHEWTGTVPYEEAPYSINPSADRIVTANDKLVDDDYPHFISTEWMNGYRGERIRALIDAKDRHTIEDSQRIQTDVYSLPGSQLVPLIIALDPKPETESGRAVLEALATWDFELVAGVHGGPIAYRLTSRALQEQVFGFLGSILPRYLGYSRTGVGGFWGLFGRSIPRIIHDIRTDDRTLLDIGVRLADEGRVSDSEAWWNAHDSWRATVAAALDRAGTMWSGESAGDEADEQLRLPGTGRRGSVAHGAPPTAGSLARAGRLQARHRFHRLRLQHPLGVVPGLASVANHGPFAVPGDADTVWAAGSFNNTTNDNGMVGPSHRHLVDLADLDNSRAVLCGGQSGHPASPNYVDQVGLWLRGETRPAPWSDVALEKLTAFHQQLIP